MINLLELIEIVRSFFYHSGKNGIGRWWLHENHVLFLYRKNNRYETPVILIYIFCGTKYMLPC